MIVGAMADDGAVLDPEIVQKLFQLTAEVSPLVQPAPEELSTVVALQRKRAQDQAQARQQEHFGTEIDKLDLQRRFRELEREQAEARKRLFEAQDEIDERRDKSS